MPRSRRRRVNDRRREAEQRLAAREALKQRKADEHSRLGRYVKAVLRPRAGEVIKTHDGCAYVVQNDGSLRKTDGGLS